MNRFRRRYEERLDAELRFDFEERVAAHMRAGLREQEARRLVRHEFGALEQIKEECRDVRPTALFESLLQDVRYALRGMRRSPGFTTIGVATLAVAIGLNFAVFTLSSAILFKGFRGVEQNDRIVYLSSRGYGCCVSYPDFADWRAQSKSFSGMGAVRGIGIVLSDAAGPARQVDATQVTANTFRLAGQQPFAGRDFRPQDEMPGAPSVVIVSHSLWESRYGRDPSIVGRVVRLNGAPATIIGVMPREFSFPQKQDLWMPLVPTAEVRKREARMLWLAFGVMRPGVTRDAVRAEMQLIGKRLEKAYPRTNKDQPPVIQSFNEFFMGRNSATVYKSMWGAVLCVLLIACANLANLTLARAVGRSRELFVRVALGAGRGRIARQLLVESLLLSALAALAGWWVARAVVRAYALATAHVYPWLVLDYSVDYAALGYMVALTAGASLLFGLMPAARLSRVNISGAMKRSSGGKLSALLVSAGIALALVLLAGAGVMVRSFLKLYSSDLGIETRHVIAADFTLPNARYPGDEQRVRFFEALRTRLEAVPGMESAALASRLPTNGSASSPFELSGGARDSTLWTVAVSSEYFRTMGTAITAGREFIDSDVRSSSPVAIVNRRFADQYLHARSPIGERIRLFRDDKPGPWLTIVGVSPNIAQNGVTRRDSDALLYVPYQQAPSGEMWVFARTRVPAGGLINAFGQEVKALDPDIAAFGPFTLDERLSTWNYWSNGILGTLFMITAAAALLLSAVGLFGVVAHQVSRRTREIGVRMAIGATRQDVWSSVLRRGMLPVMAGVAVGIPAALQVTPVLKSALVDVAPDDPVSLAAAVTVLICAALIGCVVPAHRAMRVNPMEALRHD